MERSRVRVIGAFISQLHQIAEFVLGAWIQELEGIVFKRGVDARL